MATKKTLRKLGFISGKPVNTIPPSVLKTDQGRYIGSALRGGYSVWHGGCERGCGLLAWEAAAVQAMLTTKWLPATVEAE